MVAPLENIMLFILYTLALLSSSSLMNMIQVKPMDCDNCNLRLDHVGGICR